MKYLFFLSAIIFSTASFAQSLTPMAIASSGGYFVDVNGNSLSATVAEMTMTATFKATIGSNDYVFTQGFQQPSAEDLTGWNELNNLSSGQLIYPNPSNGNINIDLSYPSPGAVQIMAYDVLGRATPLIKNYVYTSNTARETVQMNITSLPAGVYFISIAYESATTHQQLKATYKITIIKD